MEQAAQSEEEVSDQLNSPDEPVSASVGSCLISLLKFLGGAFYTWLFICLVLSRGPVVQLIKISDMIGLLASLAMLVGIVLVPIRRILGFTGVYYTVAGELILFSTTCGAALAAAVLSKGWLIFGSLIMGIGIIPVAAIAWLFQGRWLVSIIFVGSGITGWLAYVAGGFLISKDPETIRVGRLICLIVFLIEVAILAVGVFVPNATVVDVK